MKVSLIINIFCVHTIIAVKMVFTIFFSHTLSISLEYKTKVDKSFDKKKIII